MKLSSTFFSLSLAIVSVSAAPFRSLLQARAAVDAVSFEAVDAVWKIHESCNGTQRAQISRAVSDMKLLATSSLEHLLNHPVDSFFVTYFGEAADPAAVIGYFSQLMYGDKGDALLRCDDPDGNCRFDDWNGHWRGDNATEETVICDRSYSTRRPREQLCAFNFDLATDNPNTYFAADLLHRAFHVPNFVHGKVHHHADSYHDCLDLAKTNATAAVENQHSLQYFALDVFSRKMTKWDCVGEVEGKMDDSASQTTQPAPQPTPETQGTKDCHTHADGSVHCGTH